MRLNFDDEVQVRCLFPTINQLLCSNLQLYSTILINLCGEQSRIRKITAMEQPKCAWFANKSKHAFDFICHKQSYIDTFWHNDKKISLMRCT